MARPKNPPKVRTTRYHVGCADLSGPQSRYILGGQSIPYRTEVVEAGEMSSSRSARYGAVLSLEPEQVERIVYEAHCQVIRGRSVIDARHHSYRYLPGDRPVGMLCYCVPTESARPPADDVVGGLPRIIASEDEWSLPEQWPAPAQVAIEEEQGGLSKTLAAALSVALSQALGEILPKLTATPPKE